jgi:hypothetical protein
MGQEADRPERITLMVFTHETEDGGDRSAMSDPDPTLCWVRQGIQDIIESDDTERAAKRFAVMLEQL